MLGTASAAAVLAELHGIKSERDYDSDVRTYHPIILIVTAISLLPTLTGLSMP